MFIVCFIDFQAQPIPDGITIDSQFKDKVINFAKNQIKSLRQIDNVIKELLKFDDFSFQKGLGIYAVNFFEKMNSFNIEYGNYSFTINREHIERLIEGYRILFVPECTIFVPVLSSPKWVKGLIREKDFELQIFAPGFILKEEKFQLQVIEYESEIRKILVGMARGKLLILYALYSQLF
ncbi:MAG: hypothetical protein ACTSYB_18585 [Candidatus Helarchaeota archaeon]